MTAPSSAAPQRIAVLVKRFPRLSETFILNESLELRRQGLVLDLYSIMDPGESQVHAEARALVPEVSYLQKGAFWRTLPTAFRAARRHPRGTLRALTFALSLHSIPAFRNLVHELVLVELLSNKGPVHLHAHFLHSPGAIAFIARKISGQRYSVTGHAKDIYTILPENLEMRCRGAQFVTTCTAANRDYLLKVTGLEPSAVHLCRHGVDVARFAMARRQPSPGRILTVGRLVPKKGVDVLIRACGDLRRQGVAFDLRIIGSDRLPDQLQWLAEAEGVAGQITFLSARPQEEVAVELAAAEVFALTPVVLPDGDRDGFPNVFLEAMAVGLPVVASAVSGIPEAVTDHVNGRLVPERSPERLAGALAELLSDESARRRLGAAGREWVMQECRWEQAVAPLTALLKDAVEGVSTVTPGSALVAVE